MFKQLAIVLFVIVIGPATVSAADTVPDFGDSFQYARGETPIQLADVRGKNVLVLFFQSWCPKCNVWSGEMFNQITKRFGDDRSIVLMAVYTHGNVQQARQYLGERKVDLDKWIVVADIGEQYYSQIDPNTSLFTAMVVGPDGKIAHKAYAGSYLDVPGKKQYVVGTERYAQQLPEAKPFVNIEGEIPAALRSAVDLAERGHLGPAARLAGRVRSVQHRDTAQQMVADLEAKARQRVEQVEADLADQDNPDRYLAFLRAEHYGRTLLGTAAGTKVRKLVNDTKREKSIRDEAAAHQMYRLVMNKAATQPKVRRSVFIQTNMKPIAKRYPDTIYGRKAQAHL